MQQAAAEERCEVVDPSDPALATRKELSKTIDMLLWGLAVLLLCTCCPLGLLFSVVLSVVSGSGVLDGVLDASPRVEQRFCGATPCSAACSATAGPAVPCPA